VVSLKVPGLLPDDPQVEIRIISPLSLKGTVAPGIFYIHGGGGLVVGLESQFRD
jgi:acetyl esterase/lipase